MNTTTAKLPCPLPRAAPSVVVIGVVVSVLAAMASLTPRWLAAIGLALTIFYALKIATLHGVWCRAPAGRLLGYLLFWPGMNARTFLAPDRPVPPRPAVGELIAALLKLAFGLGLVGWATEHAFTAPIAAVGWIGMLGVIFTFHFGLFHVLSWAWRRAGVSAPVLMRAPIVARSLSEFWGERWNRAFAELARRFMLRPLARRYGVMAAGAIVFLASGIVHEIAISLPARGGWGGPTLYFVLQALGVGVEKSRAGCAFGLGRGFRGWLWTLLFTAAPLPLLLHSPAIERVAVPLFCFLQEAL